MNTRIIKYGTEYLGLICENKELKDIISDFIEKRELSFSFKELSNHIKRVAEENNYFEKERYVEYTSIELRHDVVQLINEFLWNMIWNKELMIDFSNKNIYGMHSNDDFMFIKVEDKK